MDKPHDDVPRTLNYAPLPPPGPDVFDVLAVLVMLVGAVATVISSALLLLVAVWGARSWLDGVPMPEDAYLTVAIFGPCLTFGLIAIWYYLEGVVHFRCPTTPGGAA